MSEKVNKNKVGHPRNFKTPADLKKAWNEFKEDLESQSNEWVKVQYVGKDGDRKTDAQKVPMTYEGFKRYCRNHYGEVRQYFENTEGLFTEYLDICCAIKEEIRESQIIGGLLGFYNPSITQRLNGLVEKTQTEIKSEQPLFGNDEK